MQVYNGREALELYNQYSFDLLRLDFIVPEVDDVKVLETIQEQKIVCFVLVSSAGIQTKMKQRVVN